MAPATKRREVPPMSNPLISKSVLTEKQRLLELEAIRRFNRGKTPFLPVGLQIVSTMPFQRPSTKSDDLEKK
jgi:hypothetical protein